MTRQISDERKLAYYVGTGLSVLGMLLFLSVFVTGAMHIGGSGGFGSGPKSDSLRATLGERRYLGHSSSFQSNAQSSVFRAVGGMALLILGGVIRNIGARGLAGSGVLLNPEQARSDLEPYSRMAGGMVKDALDEADVSFGGSAESKTVIMVRCRECGKLNEDDSKFCQECGQQI